MASPYTVPIADLERSAHVPVEEQVTSQQQPRPEPPVADADLARQRLLGITSAG